MEKKSSNQGEPSTGSGSNALESRILEISAGADIIETLENYACQRGRGVSIMSGNGTVTDATLRNSVNSVDSVDSSNSVVIFNGRSEMLSLTGTVLPPPAPAGANGVSVILSGGDGRVVGGVVVGPLVADGVVVLVVAEFANAVFERLSFDQHRENQG